MIKVNLLPVKKKKKAKQIPGYLIATIGVTLLTIAVMGYLFYMFDRKVVERRATIAENERTIAELDKKIKDVVDYEKRNQEYRARRDVIEQLGKNKVLPVKVIDEVSTHLPNGVWLTSMDVKSSGAEISLKCTAFTNTDVVNYVNNLKSSKLFADVYLNESIQATSQTFSVYNFSIVIKVKS